MLASACTWHAFCPQGLHMLLCRRPFSKACFSCYYSPCLCMHGRAFPGVLMSLHLSVKLQTL